VKNRRLVTIGIIGAAVLSLGLTGCGPKTDGASGTPATTSAAGMAPKDVLVKAVKSLNDNPYTFAVKAPDTNFDGAIDTAGKNLSLKVTSESDGSKVTFDILAVAAKRYLKITGMEALGVPAKWLRLDFDKLGKKTAREMFSTDDPANLVSFADAIVTAERTGEGAYKGTVDLTKATNSILSDDAVVKLLGDKAKAAPFTATVDAQGRLTHATVTADAKTTIDATFSKIGTKPTIAAPPANQVVDAPASVYDLFKD